MSTFIIIAIVLALVHFVYESIIAPSIRLHLRNRLFELRDCLRVLKIDGLAKSHEEAFDLLHEGINNLLTRLPQLTVANTVLIENSYKSNPELRQKIDSRVDAIKKCGNNEIVDIFEKTNEIVEAAFMANMGGWFFYLIPIAVMVAAFSKLSTFTKELIATPRVDSDRMFGNQNGFAV